MRQSVSAEFDLLLKIMTDYPGGSLRRQRIRLRLKGDDHVFADVIAGQLIVDQLRQIVALTRQMIPQLDGILVVIGNASCIQLVGDKYLGLGPCLLSSFGLEDPFSLMFRFDCISPGLPAPRVLLVTRADRRDQ